jgi:dihydroorotase-like cyclic amidohydrolase
MRRSYGHGGGAGKRRGRAGRAASPLGALPNQLRSASAARGFVSTGEDFLARESFDKNSLAWMKTFRASGKAGVVSMLHAEDWSIMAEAQERLMTENSGGGGTLHNFAQSAPIVAEVLAVQRGMGIAEATGSPIYILHVSSGRR